MWNKTIAISVAVVLLQCSVSDDERCPAGFTYRPESMSCHKNESDTSLENDGSPDDSLDGGNIQGMGISCVDSKECEAFTADYCAVNPLSKQGFCTLKNCEPGDCPGGYTCCDCTMSPLVDQEEACIADEFVADLQALAKCVC